MKRGGCCLRFHLVALALTQIRGNLLLRSGEVQPHRRFNRAEPLIPSSPSSREDFRDLSSGRPLVFERPSGRDGPLLHSLPPFWPSAWTKAGLHLGARTRGATDAEGRPPSLRENAATAPMTPLSPPSSGPHLGPPRVPFLTPLECGVVSPPGQNTIDFRIYVSRSQSPPPCCPHGPRSSAAGPFAFAFYSCILDEVGRSVGVIFHEYRRWGDLGRRTTS